MTSKLRTVCHLIRISKEIEEESLRNEDDETD